MLNVRPPAAIAKLHRRQGGQVLVLVILLLAVIGGMSAAAVDLGSYALDRRDLQNAADAIALAASQELPNNDAVNTIANQWATKNNIPLANMTVTITQQSIPSVPNPKVQITVHKNHNFAFARMVGIMSSDVAASGTAIRTSPGGSTGLVPWSIKESVVSGATPGQSLIIKYDANNVQTGNFGPVRIDGTGSNIYRDTIEHGSTNGLCASGVSGCSYPSTVQTQTGNMTGPTRTATDWRLSNTSTACDTWAETTIIVNGKEGLNPACNPFGPNGNTASKDIIVIPVINNLCNGACNVTILAFAMFYLEGYGPGGCNGNNCDIQGRFISSNTNYGALSGTFDPTGFAHFVKLVQ